MRRNSNSCTAATILVNTRKTSNLRNSIIFSKSSKPNLGSNDKFPESSMTLPISVDVSQPTSEIKQNKTKRLSWKVGSKIPKFNRTLSTQSKKSESFGSENDFIGNRENLNDTSSSSTTSNSKYNASENAESNVNLMENNGHITSEENKSLVKVGVRGPSRIPTSFKSIRISNNDSAPSLISNLEKMSTSTTKTHKKNVKAFSSKTLPRNFWSLIGKKNKPPELVTTPSLSPPSINRFSYTSPPPSIQEKAPRRKRGNIPVSGNFPLTKQTLVNVMLRKGRNRSSEDSSTTNGSKHPVLTYESFPDPGPEDFVDVYSWDLPDSISATEDAGGVLQMVEYDGIYVNGLKVN